MEEVWKDIEGYEGLYQVSTSSRVRSYDRQWFCGENGTSFITRKGRVLTHLIKRGGYAIVNLYNENGMKSKTVHRIVAKAFIPNPENKPQVNHIDFNRQNNSIENLEWVTVKENSLHSFGNYIEHSLSQLKVINDSGMNNKPVLMFDKEGTFLKEFPSASEASREMTGKVTATISNHIRDKNTRKTAYGYTWEYKEN